MSTRKIYYKYVIMMPILTEKASHITDQAEALTYQYTLDYYVLYLQMRFSDEKSH